MACDAITLAQDAGFSALESDQKQAAIFGLLCALYQTLNPMATCDAISLAGENPCFHCLTTSQKSAAIFSLMCAILAGITGLVMSGVGDPNGVFTAAINTFYRQTDAPGAMWIKTIDGGNTGWVRIN